MGKSASKIKSTAIFGNPNSAQILQLSRKYKMNTHLINLLKQKYNMYCLNNDMITLHSYINIYREFKSLNATDSQIVKSFNLVDKDQDGLINFYASYFVFLNFNIIIS